MKKLFLSLIALVAVVGMNAQQIAVVQSDGSTTVHSQLADAIEAANAGSVIYLPGGSFPIADEVKITKPITIIGIGHNPKNDNAEEYSRTTVTGNLFFNEGSSGSAVMGIYLTGNLYIANDEKKVDNILVRWNNINELYVQNKTCEGTVVNQNYIRNSTFFNGAKGDFLNNIAHSIVNLDNGTIAYNVFCYTYHYYPYAMYSCDQCAIKHNVILNWGSGPHSGASCTAFDNMGRGDWDLDKVFINVSGAESWNEVFENPAGIDPNSSYHFKGEYKQYEHQCGIYAGNGGFSDTALPPIPYIVSKSIPQQTDSEGKLNIKVRVRASE